MALAVGGACALVAHEQGVASQTDRWRQPLAVQASCPATRPAPPVFRQSWSSDSVRRPAARIAHE